MPNDNPSQHTDRPIRVAINGFGRIGELTFRRILDDGEGSPLRVVAINDIIDLDDIAYLLRYDSVHHGPDVEFEHGDGRLTAGPHDVVVLKESKPENLPWSEMGVDIAIESSGAFTAREGMDRHLEAGASKVLLTAAAKGDGADVTICVGVNDGAYEPDEHHRISNASCTTNCLAPVARCLDEAFGLKWGLMSTVHAYTGSQSLTDAAQKKRRRGRAAALNIVPTTTGAARAIGLVLPHLDGKLDGMAFRVPVPDGSVIDLVVETRDAVDVDTLHDAFAAAAGDPSYRGVLGLTRDALVSSDVIGDPRSAVVDAGSTIVLDDHRAKIVAFYDNEWGYASRVVDLAKLIASSIG